MLFISKRPRDLCIASSFYSTVVRGSAKVTAFGLCVCVSVRIMERKEGVKVEFGQGNVGRKRNRGGKYYYVLIALRTPQHEGPNVRRYH